MEKSPEEKETFLGLSLGQPVSFKGETGWEVCAWDKTDSAEKPIGIIKSQGHPGKPTWVKKEELGI